MRASRLRNSLCWTLVALFPLSLMAANTGAAMLYTKGIAWINGSTVPRSSAVFPGDLVQTQLDSMANINAAGWNVMVLSDSLVKFEGDAVSLEHGGVNVATSKGMATRAGEVTVAPATKAWTEFEVTNLDGKVQIVAQKGDVTITDGSGASSTLPQGQQTTRDESQSKEKERRRRGAGAPPAASRAILDMTYAKWLGAGAVGGLTTWVLLQGDDPLSPSDPSK
jgi:hypothetical protein